VFKSFNGNVSKVFYYINEGIYSNFLFLLLGPEVAVPKVLKSKRTSEVKYETTVWGPTMDSDDILCKNVDLNLLNIGDILYFENMGSYSSAMKTSFNTFDKTDVFYYLDEDDV
jgi:ornithine decarboxylase